MSENKTDKIIHYVMPYDWSLHYFMTKKEWEVFRNKVKKVTPGWGECSCPNRCEAKQLDELWEYDRGRKVKIFKGAEFLCPGCHWRKSVPWRIRTWLRRDKEGLPPLAESDHLRECLGWTRDEVLELREHDLEEHESQMMAAIEREFDQEVGAGEIRYWTVDLSELKRFGYRVSKIDELTDRMNEQQRKRPRRKRTV